MNFKTSVYSRLQVFNWCPKSLCKYTSLPTPLASGTRSHNSPVSRSSLKDNELPPKVAFLQYYLREILDAARVYSFIFNKLLALLKWQKDLSSSVCQANNLSSAQLVSSMRNEENKRTSGFYISNAQLCYSVRIDRCTLFWKLKFPSW